MEEKDKTFNIGQRIHEIRIQKKLSQEQLALSSNITPTYLGLIERNIKNPTVKVVERLSDALGVTLTDFFSENCEDVSKMDEYSLQIMSLLNICDEKEKNFVLKILKELINLRNSDKT